MAEAGRPGDQTRDTRGVEYAQRLMRLEAATWKRLLDVQRPYRWNLRRLDLGRTLDVGCGIGRNLVNLPFGSVGVDHNATSVQVAVDRGLEALTTEAWADSPLSAPGMFDSMLLAHVVEHMPDAAAVQLVCTYLPSIRPGGKVVFICPQERGFASDSTHVRFADLDVLADLARRVGLTVERSYSFPLPRLTGRWFTYNEFVLLARTPA